MQWVSDNRGKRRPQWIVKEKNSNGQYQNSPFSLSPSHCTPVHLEYVQRSCRMMCLGLSVKREHLAMISSHPFQACFPPLLLSSRWWSRKAPWKMNSGSVRRAICYLIDGSRRAGVALFCDLLHMNRAWHSPGNSASFSTLNATAFY